MQWLFCAGVLITLAFEENDIDPRRLVMVLAFANLGYVWADVAADGFMVWIAHREKIEKRGKMQTLVYSMSKLGQICINVLILFGFSGPQMNCAGYESDGNFPCTTNPYVIARVDPELYQSSPDGWCYKKCHQATFDWNLSISYVIMINADERSTDALACSRTRAIGFYSPLHQSVEVNLH
jgi:hypothetical protein